MATSKQIKSDTVADTNIPPINNTNKSPTPKNNIDNNNDDVGTPPHQNNKTANNKSNPLEHCVTDTIEAMLSPSKLNINDKSELDGSDEKEVPTPPSSNKSINSQTKTTIIGSGSGKSRRSTRSRTRSLSSAISSLSGAEDVQDDNTTAEAQQPDKGGKDKGRDEGRDGKKSPTKTPLIKNTGPVRKRHKDGGAKKSLFNNDNADAANNKSEGDQAAVDSKDGKAAADNKGEEDIDTPPIGSKKPPPDIDNMSQLLDAPITKTAAEVAEENKKEEEIDTPPFGSSKPQPLQDEISTTTNLLPPILNNPVDEPQVSFKEDDGEEESGSGGGRARSNTIESFRAAMNNSNSNNNNNEEEESRVDIEMLPDINPLSPGGNSISTNNNNKRRSRSDTIDFLSSHVEFQVDNDMNNSTTNNNNVDIDTNGNMIYNPTPVGKATSDLMKGTTNDTYQSQSYTHHMDIYGKTPKITNRTRGASLTSLNNSIGSKGSQASLTSQGPIRKRYRTRSNSGSIATINKPERYRNNSLSINSVGGIGKESKKTASASATVDMLMDNNNNNKNDEDNGINYNEDNDNDVEGGRYRSNTLDNVFPGYRQRERSDTLDFLTAAVAGDMGHDLDAAVAAAADDGASFAMHVISAPSGASSNYTALRPIRAGSGGSDLLLHGNGSSRSRSGTMDSISRQQRPRSDTLDSTASSINSTKLDFFVQVAAEQGVLNSPVPAGGGLVGSVAGIGGKDESLLAVQHQRRPRSDTLEIYSNMNNAASALSAHRTRSDTVDFLIGTNSDDPVGDIELSDVATTAGTAADGNSNVQDHLKALCEGDPLNNTDGITTTSSSNNNKINDMKTLPPKKRRSKRKLAAAATDESKTEEDASTTATPSRTNKKTRKNSEATWKTNLSSSQDNSLMNSVNNRNRLESWGGMSDLSVGGMGSTSAIAATHQQLKDTGILDDVLAAAADLDNHGDDISSGASSLERLRRSSRGMSGGSSLSGAAKGRPRKNSLASLSLASLESDTLLPPDKSTSSKTSKKPAARKKAAKKTKQKKKDVKSTSMSSTKRTKQGADAASVNTGTGSIVVDYDAIASAVTAANAALDNLDMSAIAAMASSGTPSATKSSSAGSKPAVKVQASAGVKKIEQPKLPVKRVVIPPAATAKPTFSLPPIVPQATMKKTTPSQLTAKAPLPSLPAVNLKAAAVNSSGKKVPFPVTSINVPVPTSSSTNNNTARTNYSTLPTVPKVPAYPQVSSNVPIKKRFLPGVQSNNVIQSNNYYQIQRPRHTFAPKINTGTLQSQQKWDDMFQHLVQFIADTRAEKTKNMTEEKKSAWVWDGNVPTSYKTPSGKALGRWINNQRSAKAKGTLKDDREVRLVSTGLKWSVLTTNSWKQMLDELASYAKSQTKNGRSWDVSEDSPLIVLYCLFCFITNIYYL